MKKQSNDRLISQNKKAKHDYYIEERFEAGLELQGSEVKSLREGKMSLAESFAIIKDGEVFLVNSHIPAYQPAGQFNHDPKRTRKLLLHKREIERLFGQINRKGYTLIPTKCYFKEGYAKIEIALARGKQKGDKRELLKKKAARREMRGYK